MDIEVEKQAQQIKIKEKCSNKFCPQSLYHPDSQEEKTLCEVCNDQYKKQNYCVYCKQIYFESTDDGKPWVQCDECHKWVHAQCAQFNMNKASNLPQNKNCQFKCIRCRRMDGKEGPQRRGANRLGGGKINFKKNDSGVLYNIGFQWALKPEQIAEDLKKIQSYL